MSDSLWPPKLQHARLPCPSPSPRVCSNSCLLSWWCHLTISSTVVLFSSCLWSFPASGSFPISCLFIKWPQYQSFRFSINPPSEFPGLISFRMDWLDLLAAQETLKSLLHHHNLKASIWCSAFFMLWLSKKKKKSVFLFHTTVKSEDFRMSVAQLQGPKMIVILLSPTYYL